MTLLSKKTQDHRGGLLYYRVSLSVLAASEVLEIRFFCLAFEFRITVSLASASWRKG